MNTWKKNINKTNTNEIPNKQIHTLKKKFKLILLNCFKKTNNMYW